MRLLLIGLLCVVASTAFAQLTINAVDPGPYTPGSTIAATFSINNASCIAIGNTFQLYLSDSNGNFGSETLIGTYNGFYSTFVNGLLPAGITPGTGYKVRIKSTNPALVSNESAAFEIKAGPSVEAKLSSLPINNNTQEAFGSCAGRDNFNYAFTNESTATSTVTATVKNEMTGGAPTTIAFTTPIQTYNASLAHFTVFAKAVMPNGTVGTKAYFLINNQTVTAFSTSGNNVVCLPNSQLEFGVDISSDGILKNFPGDTYIVNWGDQSISTYTLCDIRQNTGRIRHTYTRSSCGNVFSGSSGTEYNVFAVNISVENPYCGRVGSAISSTAKVITKPVNTFSSPLTACTNATLTFANTSILGEDPNTNSPGCQPNTVTYNWYVDGVLVAANKPISFNLTYQFTTHGSHTIRLESTSSGACDADPYSTTICIQDPPQPAFNLSANPICQGATVTLNNTSIVDNICGNNTAYVWSVSPSTGVSFVGGTNNSSQNPQISFNTTGLYTITLAITSGSCTTVTTSKQLVVNTSPTATLAPDAQLCGTNTYTFDDTPGSVTRTTFTGTVQEPISTYTWTVVPNNGGTWSFVNGTNANSKYPQIKFDNFDTYTITVTHTNNCGTASASQKLTFNTAPIVNAGPDQSICYNDVSFTLAGSITGATTTRVWTGGSGTFTPDRNTLNATYAPTLAEKNAGTVTLTLTATTTLPAPCNSVSDQVILTIKPRTFVNSVASKTICTGTAVNYSPSSNIAGATFSWTATGGPGAGGFNASGNGATINDILTNSNPTTDATVTYIITPSANGCTGDPFTFTVTVTPNPALTATAVNSNICSQQNAVINLSSNLANTKYTWTSNAQAGVTGNTNSATPSSVASITNTLVNNTLLPKTVDYTITPISANNCLGTPVTVTITVEPQPSTPNAGADVSICNTGSFVLQGNQPAVGNGKWTLVSGQSGISFVDDTQYNTTANGLVAGQVYVFRWTISSAASCTPKSDDVSVTVNPASVGGTVTGSTAVCSGTNSGTLTLSGQTGNVIRWESSINGGTTWVTIANTTTTLNYSNLNTTTQYRAIVQSGVCAPDPSVAATITVSPAVVAANAGADQELCNQTSATLAANSPLPNTGLWTQAGGPAGATFVDATSATTQVNGLIPGQIYVFTWTISGQAPCPPSTDQVQIKINLPSDGGATDGSASVCSGSGSGQITLSGQVGNVVRWESSTNGGTTWQTINNTTAAINYSNLTTTTQYRAVVKNGNCAEANSTISTVTVNPAAATANAGASQELCNQTTTTLAGNSPLPNTGLWTQKSGPAGAVFADATLPNTQVSGLIPGQQYVFTWTISGQAPCPPSSSDVQVQVNLPSDGGTTSGSTAVCSGSGSGQITLSGQVGTVVRWESSTDGGATWQIINNTATSINYSNLTATTQYRAVVRNGNCATANSTVSTITVNPGSISANAGPDQELCNQTSTTLAGNSPQTQSGLWTQVSGPAVTFADASLYNTQVSGLVLGQTYVFRWTINGLAPCPPSMDDMQVKVNLPSDGGTTAGSTAVCSGSGSGSITLSGQVGAIQGWEQSTDGGATWNPISNTTGSVAYSNLTITTQYRAIVKNGNCAPAYSTIATVTVNPGSISANAGPNQELCNQTSTTLAGNSPQTQTGLWTQTGGPAGATFADASQYNTQVSGLIPGNTYTFTWTISGLAPCPPSSASVTVKVNLPSDGGTTAGSTAVCSGSGSGSITLSGQVGAIQGWEQSTDGGATWSPISNTTGSVAYSNLTITTQYRAIVKNGNCAPAYSTVATVTVNPAVAQANAGPDQTLCNGSSITLQGNPPLTNTGQWTLTSGQTGVTFADASQYNTQVNGLVGGQTYTFRWTISGSAPCPPTNDEVVITNLAPLTNTNITTAFSTACNGQVVTLAGNVPSGGNGTYTYVWESSNDGGTTWTIITGQTSPSLTITANASLSYRRTVNSGNCKAISNVLQLTVLPAIANNVISANQAICVGTNAAPISGSQPTGGDGNNYTFGWEQSTDNGATWTTIIGANAKDYAPGAITQTTAYRRLVSSGACAGALQHISNVIKITVNPNAKTEFSFTRDLDCFPFAISASNVKATAYPDRNATYTWYADNVAIGTGITFPGYTIATENTAVVIKLVATSSLGCSQDEMSHTFRTRPNILATFTPSAVNGCGPLDVDFTNTSNTLIGVTFEWRVNNVIAGTSADFRYRFDADPFGEDKDYTVILTITGPCGKSVSAPQKITVYGTPIATGTPNKTRGCSPFTVNFSNTSPGSTNTYTYEIDGVIINGPSNSKADFAYTFTTDVVKTYKVKVTATNSCGTDSREYVIVVSPNTIKPGFTVDGNKLRGCAPFDVDFTNSTVGASQYVYNFEPGQSAEISVNNRPEIKHHRFDKPGTYVVTMLATNDCSTAPVQTIMITVDPQPVAAFSANLTIGCNGLEVKFTNTSKDAISYLWDFGDGSPTSTEVAPTHVYKGNPQAFTVKLTAINSLGCPTVEEKIGYIRLVGPPKADFSISPAAVISIPDYSFKFTNESNNGAQTYKWTFGDGDASTLKDPAHTYLDTGRFLVTLRTYNEQGCVDSIQKFVHIMGVPGYVYVPNSFMPGGTSVPLQKFIAVGAGIKSWKMSVFNKWGQVLWETTKLEDGKPVEGWDGTYNNVAQPQGIYFWKIEVQLINGTEWKGVTYDKSAPKRTGEIYLIR